MIIIYDQVLTGSRGYAKAVVEAINWVVWSRW